MVKAATTTINKLISVYAHNLIKLSFLPAYIVTNQCDILCLHDSFLDNRISPFDVNLDISKNRPSSEY